ncbi:MGH1-like glycoside hydrolase domain-containing protein [Chitinophaga sp. Ak27]|uniref:MGH1-like glycoside hydrolase domain-containing protein n=1 Tax=Chitinophaga sp. Ak27 TaxID=2726116 RepID=UPI00145E3B35|nr:trehalase family glycosidase [Chitinophaga sp. Ak27]NLU95958.1 glycoside hydrolase [Chitinophaga sp. Ak27]
MRKWWWLLCCSALGVKAQQVDRQQFTDVLDIKHFVKDNADVAVNFFSDMGAWHAYALPARSADYGGFIGPLLMEMEGRWLSNSIAKLHVSAEDKTWQPENGTTHYYPGLIEQSYRLKDIQVRLHLIFTSRTTAMLHTELTNLGRKPLRLHLRWEGSISLPSKEWQQHGQQLSTNVNGHTFYIDYLSTGKWDIHLTDTGYTSAKTILLPAKGHWQETQCHSYRQRDTITASFDVALQQNHSRWNGYLQSVLGNDTILQRLKVKCLMTLMTNWRSAYGHLKHDGIFPSASYQGFYGFWAWDSWKQAAATCLFYPALAKDNIRAMFDYQQPDGMVIDCIYADSSENNARDTKPPLAAWAVWEVFRHTGDTAFVREMYAPLVRYHRWWYADRDHDRDSLCEYGATDGTRIAAAWESGMDNAVRFDHARMQQNHDHAWSLNQSSVDLNAYLYAEKQYLGKMATLLRLEDVWTAPAAALKEKINQQYFDTATGFYYDSHDSLVKIQGAEGWIPLWAGIATPAQAVDVAAVMQQPAKFNTKVPLPVLAADHPAFDPLKGYWRGPVWLDQFYFGIMGLEAYGYQQQADALLTKLWEHAEGMKDNHPLYENYHPLTGKGLNARNFSWSAAHILLLLQRK